MTGILGISSIEYNTAVYDEEFCEMTITGIAETNLPGQYAIVRYAAGCAEEYPIGVFESIGNETVEFSVSDVINIEGSSSDFHPTTGEVTDLYLKYGGTQVGNVHKFTVGSCEEDWLEEWTPAIVASVILAGAAFIIYSKTKD